MEEIQTDVLIIGGGVAGSAMALALKNSPFSINLIEPRIGQDVNRGDVLYPASLEIIQKWNALDGFIQRNAIQFTHLTGFHNTKEILSIDLSTLNPHFPYGLSIDHKDIEEILLEEAQTDRLTVYKGYTALEAIKQNDTLIGYTIVGKGERKNIKAKLIIGADGAKSRVRNDVQIQTTFTQYDRDSIISWMPLKEEFPVGSFIFVDPPSASLAQVLPGKRLRVASFVPRGTGASFIKQTPLEKYNQLTLLSDYFTKAEPQFFDEHVYAFMSHNAQRYSHQNTVLIGDAAHVTHPISSQGIGMAISDAYVLATILNNSLDNLEEKFSHYEVIRKPSVTKIIEHSKFLAETLLKHAPVFDSVEKFFVFLLEHISLLRNILGKEMTTFEYESIAKTPPAF